MIAFTRRFAVIAILISALACAVYCAADPQQKFMEEIGCEKALIVNADDLGRSKWSNEGIVKAYREGIVTSMSLMAPALEAEAAYDIVRENPDLDVGVHFVLARDDVEKNLYSPLSPPEKVASLIDDNGYFITDVNEIITAVPQKEMGIELSAQTKALYDNGVDVTHLDCHKAFYHLFDKKSVYVATRLARKYNLPIRWTGRHNDRVLIKNRIIVPNQTTMVNMRDPYEKKKETFLGMLDRMKPGITEIVCHPATGGFTPEEAKWRSGDLQLVLDPDVRAAVEKNGICLIGYRQLRDFQRKINSN